MTQFLDTDKINFHAVSESLHISELITKSITNIKKYKFCEDEFTIATYINSESNYIFNKIHSFLIEDNNISFDTKLKIIEGIKSLFLDAGKAIESLISNNQDLYSEYQDKRAKIENSYNEKIKLSGRIMADYLVRERLAQIEDIKISFTQKISSSIVKDITDVLINKSKEYINNINNLSEEVIIGLTPSNITPENIKNNLTNINKSKTKHSSLK